MIDFEDAIVSVSEMLRNCDYLVTRNLADFKGSPTKAISPEELLDTIATHLLENS